MRREVKQLILDAENSLNVDELALERLEGLGDLSPAEVRALHVLRHVIYDRDLLESDTAAQDHQREVLRSLLASP